VSAFPPLYVEDEVWQISASSCATWLAILFFASLFFLTRGLSN